MDRETVWFKSKAREKSDIARITDESREKVESEAEATLRVKEKAINSKRVAEAGAVTKVRVEAKAGSGIGIWGYWRTSCTMSRLHPMD